jgi:hypothetical protein
MNYLYFTDIESPVSGSNIVKASESVGDAGITVPLVVDVVTGFLYIMSVSSEICSGVSVAVGIYGVVFNPQLP